MESTERKKISNYLLIGLLSWLIIDSFTAFINQVLSLPLISIGLHEKAVFFAIQILIIFLAFYLPRLIFSKIIKEQPSLKRLLVRLILLYIFVLILKFAGYFSKPFLIVTNNVQTLHYLQELKNNRDFVLLQIIVNYFKIVIFALSIYFYKKQES